MKPAKPLNTKIFFWCCKPLGFHCLQYLIHLIDTKYPSVHLTGICIHEKDVYNPEIYHFAVSRHLPIYDQRSLDIPSSDLGLIIGYPQKISAAHLQLFRHGVINLHFAPLPKYRGSGTLAHAIINDENEYGVTFHYVDETLDTGPIIDVAMIPLPKNKTAQEIKPLVEELGFQFFQQWIEKFLCTLPTSTPQEEIITKQKIKPLFCTRQSVKQLYQFSMDWSFEKMYTYLRALTNGKEARPYLQQGKRKIYLSLK